MDDRTKDKGLAPLRQTWDGLVRYDAVQFAVAFITGYLGEHKGMLEDLGVHQKVIASVQYLIDEVDKL